MKTEGTDNRILSFERTSTQTGLVNSDGCDRCVKQPHRFFVNVRLWLH